MRAGILTVAVLGLLATAMASCPNQCSGHGRCAANDKCECYTQANTVWGNRYMYTGADCSLRTCPLGTAPDGIANYHEGVGPVALTTRGPTRGATDFATSLNVYLSQELLLNSPSVTLNIKITDATLGSRKFVWKYASDPSTYYSQPITFVTRATATTVPADDNDILLWDPPQALAQSSQTRTGIRVYFDTTSTSLFVGDEYTVTVTRPTGIHWVKSNDNTLHQGAECSRRGICDTTTGKCKCFTGFGGEACQRTTCPNDCSGHGMCQDEYHFADDAGKDYGQAVAVYTDAYDAHRQMGCKCDLGYRGPDCSLIECPSGADPLSTNPLTETFDQAARDCSGRGICDYSIGQCKCFKGYFGERCESQTNFV